MGYYSKSNPSEIAINAATNYCQELNNTNPMNEFHVISFVAEAEKLSEWVYKSSMPNNDSASLVSTKFNDSTEEKYGVIYSVLALNKKNAQFKKETLDYKEKLESITKSTIENSIAQSTYKTEENKELASKLINDVDIRVQIMIPGFLHGYMVVIMPSESSYERGYGDTDNCEVMKVETVVSNDQFKILLIILICPK